MTFRNILLFLVISTLSVQSADLMEVSAKYIGQTETGGNNRSPFIDKINRFAGVPVSSYWCASFVNWVHYEAGITNRPQKPAWSPNWFTKNRVTFAELKRGDCVGYYMPKEQRIAHIGIFTGETRGNYRLVIEGNTSPVESVGEAERNGQGIYKKLRNAKLLEQGRNKFSRWNP